MGMRQPKQLLAGRHHSNYTFYSPQQSWITKILCTNLNYGIQLLVIQSFRDTGLWKGGDRNDTQTNKTIPPFLSHPLHIAGLAFHHEEMSSRYWIIKLHMTQHSGKVHGISFLTESNIGIPVIILSENGKSWTEVVEKFTTFFKRTVKALNRQKILQR